MPPSKDICIKMGIFCHMRRTKRDLLGRGGRKGVKGTQIKTEKVRDRRLNYTLESFIGKEGHIFFFTLHFYWGSLRLLLRNLVLTLYAGLITEDPASHTWPTQAPIGSISQDLKARLSFLIANGIPWCLDSISQQSALYSLINEAST